ncbi:MAG TPA: response regulator [Polyangiaceae bacterium]|jgi:signal transduction histidine kinase
MTKPTERTEAGRHEPQEQERPSGRATVWILDDSPMEAAMARRTLAVHYEVETFVDGSVMLERLAAGHSPSALVLDWQLPGMSGIEVCRFLRSTRDEMQLPILMLTVYGHKTDLVDGLAAGANDYLTKPYEAPELAARVATLVRVRMLHERARRAEQRSADLLAKERIARTDAEQANHAKDGFLAMVSHELRTPLNAILGWTRVMRSGGLPADQVEKALATVERNALAQTQLIEELMDMSRIVSGKLTIERQPVELVGVIQSSVEAVRLSAQTKSIAVQLKIEPEAGRITGDPARLQQVLLNLLTNAIKFTPKGGSVLVSLERGEGCVRLSVADSGAGIAPDFLPHVFERFRQGTAGDRRVQAGLGLGLAIVKHIVELHDGFVEARSAGEGLGATFVVTLPLAQDGADLSNAAGRNPMPADVGASARLAGLRVLLVDDDPDALELLSTMLARHGAEALRAASVTKALEAVLEHRPDVLVSDVAMPGRDGLDLIRSLRLLSEECGGRTPALVVTAFASPRDRARALAAGFDMYASKPVDLEELVLSIASLARRKLRVERDAAGAGRDEPERG